jgi:hypothetical protein
MAITCLSRTLDETDYTHLAPELQYVDHEGIGGQHPVRRWEYALALHAVSRWIATGRTPAWVYDVEVRPVFSPILDDWLPHMPITVHPAFVEACVAGSMLANVITALGVLDHVPDAEAFLYGAANLLAPGGLLVLTMAFWNRCGPDTAVNADTRARIYCPKAIGALRAQAADLQLTPFGGVDPTWHGPQIHDYSLTSLVLQKGSRP